MTSPALPCSDAARERGDALTGTGSQGLRWFLLEIDSPWGHSAFLNAERALDPDLGLRIARRAESAGMRTLAIRRPGRRRGEGRWRWAIVDSRVGSESIKWGEVSAPEEVLTLPLDGSTGAPSNQPIVAVCAHGRHDRCCAVRGRRVLPPLMDHDPENTWECSHLGGDRFAGTMIVFPEGLYYGNVDDSDVVAIVDAHRQGLVEPRFLRGRSSLPAPVQVAQHHAREALFDNRIDTFHPVSVEQDGSTLTVTLDHDGQHLVVMLEQGLSEPITTTCAATRPGGVRTFQLVSISE
ncbi:sucrase ferredoxin [Rhodococcus sp. G-MC3]|uniref:sucrase ferredoxin n=1 Tax=Rhodococcus sp. G-MC3 TaxID=3046209 RepID=UPI0024BAF725|nr:sucrase ferredoxin [Rhodococcus sp. G-MC3]MDJ0395114.1 sucrase ferredoxin [Rhodococcus sp. G-MC3]